MTGSFSHGKWAEIIIALQHEDGSWGHFHTLSKPTKQQPMTTEQALRRLGILGLTKEDEPIHRAMKYMESCLTNTEPTVFHEKKHDSKTYGDLMLAAWLTLFDRNNELALTVSRKWANIISSAFESGEYKHDKYVKAYESEIGIKLNPKAGCLANFVVFYQLSILPGLLSANTELAMLDYVISHNSGIGYIYDKPLNILPEVFASRKASRYIAALEILSDYTYAPEKLGFASRWILENRSDEGLWDMGAEAKDDIYFPLSDSWRNAEVRKHDCAYRIKNLLGKIRV